MADPAVEKAGDHTLATKLSRVDLKGTNQKKDKAQEKEGSTKPVQEIEQSTFGNYCMRQKKAG